MIFSIYHRFCIIRYNIYINNSVDVYIKSFSRRFYPNEDNRSDQKSNKCTAVLVSAYVWHHVFIVDTERDGQ